jgi:hypothetical protein
MGTPLNTMITPGHENRGFITSRSIIIAAAAIMYAAGTKGYPHAR